MISSSSASFSLSVPPRLRATHVRVDLAAIAHNVAVIRRLAGPTTLCAVVKADAYGHGAVRVARALVDAGVDQLAVALVEEGLVLRQAGITCPILVLAGNFVGAYEAVLAAHLTPVVGQMMDVRGFGDTAQRLGVACKLHIEIDTGMARLGTGPDALGELVDQTKRFARLEVVGLMSHFSHSDVPGAAATHEQVQRMAHSVDAVQKTLPHLKYRHIINSGALITAPSAPREMVRCGLSLYGVQPTRHGLLPGLQPALSWHTRVVAVRSIPAGAPVSYGGRWRAPRPSRIATLPVGYADGYPRQLSMRSQVLIRNQRVPQIGNICMDLCMVDVTDVPEVALGDEVVLMGPNPAPDAIELASLAETISWEILSRIGPRVPRIYTEPQPGGPH